MVYWLRVLAQGDVVRFMCKQVGESQNYVLRQPADLKGQPLGYEIVARSPRSW